jgi:signal transduction histidine kinase
LEQGFGDARAGLRPTLLSFDDGLPNIQSGAPSSAAQGGDGRVWFSTLGGAVWIDPAHFIRNVLSPPVVIRALAAQGINYSDPTNLNLPRGTSSVAIVYAGLSLAMPSRVRFRYRLSGIDREWVDAGTRREASYSNLRPGTYRFQVIAANNDGVWNREGATLAFTIPPTFLQSLWFKALLVLALLVIAWCAYAIRLRQVTATLQGRFDIRVAERERIARELHDTLLQGVQGLLLRFQAVANRIPPDDGLRGAIDEALDRADDVLVEGRKRVRDLRSEAAETDLAQALLQVAADLVDGDAPRVRLTMEGSPRPLHPIVREEAQRIAEEAVRNACRHAKAQSIDLLLTYGPRHLRLAVRDDGAGMPESVLANGRQAGHFGLVGMRERATRVGGRLDVTSRAPGGTEVTLMLPARVAYADGRRRFLDQLRLISRGAPER